MLFRSHGSRLYDRDFKQVACRSLGVGEVWRADLRDRAIDVVRADGSRVVALRERLEWQAPGLATSLTLDVGSLFDGIEGDD